MRPLLSIRISSSHCGRSASVYLLHVRNIKTDTKEPLILSNRQTQKNKSSPNTQRGREGRDRDHEAPINSLGILLMARSGRSTRIVRIADRLRFCVSTAYSTALQNKHTSTATSSSRKSPTLIN